MARRVILATFFMFLILSKAEGGWDRSVEEWKDWSSTKRLYYLMGVLDGWVNVNATVSQTKDMEKRGQIATDFFVNLVDCQTSKLLTYEKVYSFVENEMNVYPAPEKSALASTIWTAIARACGYKFPE